MIYIGGTMEITWSKITNNPSKIDLFSHDQYFRISSEIGSHILGSGFEDKLKSYALVVIKPESTIFHRAKKIVELIENEGFKLVFFLNKTMSRTECIELWRYQWNAASSMRMLISSKLTSYCPSYFLIFEAPKTLTEIASTHLSRLKGSAIESQRNEGHFRSILQPINRMLNYLHVSDEPADVIREIGVLLDWDMQLKLYHDLNNQVTIPTDHILSTIDETFNSLIDPITALNNLNNQVDERKKYGNLIEQQWCDRVTHDINAALLNGKKLNLSFFNHLQLLGMLEWSLELLLIATTFIEYESNQEKMLAYKFTEGE
jgi:hypothetical protein